MFGSHPQRALCLVAVCMSVSLLSAQVQPLSSAAAMRTWKGLLPQVTASLAKTQHDCPRRISVEITATADLAGDGQSTALVDFCQAGASTDEITVMQLRDGRPVPATFLGRNGKAFVADFVDGASAMHADDVKLVPAEQAIYTESSSNDSMGRLAHCSVNAYVWDRRRAAFAFNVSLSRRATGPYCSRMRKQLAQQR